jgi:hypothetical protein
MNKTEGTAQPSRFEKQYSVAIDTVPLPERPAAHIHLIMEQITPVIHQIVEDAMSVAIGTWPTPEDSTAPLPFQRQYSVAIDTVPLPEKPAARIQLVMSQITPVIHRLVEDAMSVAIGTWPTPELPLVEAVAQVRRMPGGPKAEKPTFGSGEGEYVPSESGKEEG